MQDSFSALTLLAGLTMTIQSAKTTTPIS